MHPHLESFQCACADAVASHSGPSEIVRALAPRMRKLLQVAPEFLEPRHRQGRSDRYTRNLIFAGDDDALSLFTLVWAPGQRTPIHDHGTWGVVGVLEGMLEEQSFVRVDNEKAANPDKWVDGDAAANPDQAVDSGAATHTVEGVDCEAAEHPDERIELTPGGFVLLPPGAVVTFLPDPDHIHETGVPANRGPTLSLHLYGRFLSAFHVYDRAAGTRRLVQQEHTELEGRETRRVA